MSDWKEESLKALKIANESTLKRVTLHTGNWDWIDFAYDDTNKVGSIFIQSSYGNWSNGWSHMGKTTTLSQFFLKADKYYLTNKLWDHDEKEDYFDSDQANVDLKKEIIRARRAGEVEKEEARKYFEIIEEELDGLNDSSDLWYTNYLDTDLRDFDERIYETKVGWQPRGKFLALRDLVIPAIKKYFNGELEKREKEERGNEHM